MFFEVISLNIFSNRQTVSECILKPSFAQMFCPMGKLICIIDFQSFFIVDLFKTRRDVEEIKLLHKLPNIMLFIACFQR